LKAKASRTLLGLGAALCTALGGCSQLSEPSLPGLGSATLSQADYATIANDLVDTLAALDEVDPSVTTFQMVEPSTAFGKEMFDAIELIGYGIQMVEGDLGKHFLSYKAENSQTQDGYRNAYSVSIGEIHVEREYTRTGAELTPTSPIAVSGVREQPIASDDGLKSSSVTFTSVPRIIALVADDRRAAEANGKAVANVFDRQRSNYASAFSRYTNLDTQRLIFANDSLHLAPDNKRVLERMAAGVDPASDIISVIGCSLGGTAIDNGNQILAEGRTNRVKEWLMFAGIDAKLIFDEACWAETPWDEAVPRRGVVVTHKRAMADG